MSARPNIVLILSDQQRLDTIGALGCPWMRTPHLDCLVREGVAFTQCHAAGATCTPSRAALFTGMYAHNTGCYSFNDWAHQRLWVHDLGEAGYYCASIGKMHLMPRDEATGFHHRVVVENPTSTSRDGGEGDDAWGNHLARHGHQRPNQRHLTDSSWKEKFQGVPWALDEHLHSDVFTGDSAASWIERHAPADKPFFLEVGFPGPHEPWDPLPAQLAAYAGREAEFPGRVDWPRDFTQSPPQHAAIRDFHATVDHESRIDVSSATEDQIRRMRLHYYAKVSLVDAQVGKIVASLKTRGLLENTVLIFASDHGEMLGDHGLAYKWLMYDQVTRVPLIIRDFREPGGNHRPVTELVSLIDLGPTICELTSVQTPSRLEGRSLTGYLRNQPTIPRRYVFCEDNYLVMIRSASAKLVYYHGQPQGEAYDLVADPGETRNLWGDADFGPRKQALLNDLLAWFGASCLHTWGAKANAPADYGVRWPAPSDPNLHGANYRHRPIDFL